MGKETESCVSDEPRTAADSVTPAQLHLHARHLPARLHPVLRTLRKEVCQFVVGH